MYPFRKRCLNATVFSSLKATTIWLVNPKITSWKRHLYFLFKVEVGFWIDKGILSCRQPLFHHVGRQGSYVQATPFHSWSKESLASGNNGFQECSFNMFTSILAKESHFYKEKDTISNSSYLYTVKHALLVQPDINITCPGEYQCSSAKKAGLDLTRLHLEVLTPAHKRQIEDNSEKQTFLPQVSAKVALRMTDQNCACNRITSEAV